MLGLDRGSHSRGEQLMAISVASPTSDSEAEEDTATLISRKEQEPVRVVAADLVDVFENEFPATLPIERADDMHIKTVTGHQPTPSARPDITARQAAHGGDGRRIVDERQEPAT
jgi:hypothetical protein